MLKCARRYARVDAALMMLHSHTECYEDILFMVPDFSESYSCMWRLVNFKLEQPLQRVSHYMLL